MNQKKRKIYIVPGFGESTRMKNYRDVIKYAKQQKFEVVPIKIDWDLNKNMPDYIKEVSSQISDKEDSYILGFSFGAYISYVLSKKKKLNGYIFCTISPYFYENLKDIPNKSKEYFGDNFIKSLKKYTIHGGNKNKAWFLVGEKDWNLAKQVNREACREWSGESNFILVKNAEHELGQKNYVAQVRKIIKNLRD